jgi:cytochrome c oxidase cbb3-type subunit 2
MNNFRLIFLGFVATFATAWVGLALVPSKHYAFVQPYRDAATGAEFPPALPPLAERGRQVYQAEGCVYCHSQQVRPADAGSDIARGWGVRRTVARDYLHDGVALLGTMRTGPDLANIGQRNPSDAWHLTHLYDPQLTSPGSTMPPFPFLFEKQRIGSAPAPTAVGLPPGTIAEGWELIPSEKALALVAYLKSLRKSTYALPEAPLPAE